MGENGRLSESDLSPIPGGQLDKEAAVAWLAMRSYIGKNKGLWIAPTSPRTSYRPFADQEYFWNLYKSGRGALAAVPGTSNHGWGLAVDTPTDSMHAAIREVGHKFGWGIQGGQLSSDAPSEAWHATFHRGVFKPSPAPKPAPTSPYLLMTPGEREARDILVKERKIAQRNGGWKKVDPSHLRNAVKAKADLKTAANNIAAAAKQSGDWKANSRKARFDYINQLIGS